MWALAASTPSSGPGPVPPAADAGNQAAIEAVAKALSAQARGELRLTFAGAVGLGLLFATGYMIWRKR